MNQYFLSFFQPFLWQKAAEKWQKAAKSGRKSGKFSGATGLEVRLYRPAQVPVHKQADIINRFYSLKLKTMAELENNALGTISGTFGNLVASNWRNINYLKSKSRRTKKDPTPGQLEARAKFYLTLEFFSGIKEVLERGFNNADTGRATAFNLGLKANSNAITGIYPDLQMDYPKVVLSKGMLLGCVDQKIESPETGKVLVSWAELGEAGGGNDDDMVTIALFNPLKNVWILRYGTTKRSDYQSGILTPLSFSGDEVHAYLFFTNPQTLRNSRSFYVGSVTVL